MIAASPVTMPAERIAARSPIAWATSLSRPGGKPQSKREA